MRELFYLLDQDVYELYAAADQSSVETVIGSSSGTSEEGDPAEEVSSALPGHRWITPYVYEVSVDSFENISDVSLTQDVYLKFGNGF